MKFNDTKEFTMTGTTRLGKTVGSVKTPLEAFTYWAERNWETNAPGFMVVAPSGARMVWVATEREARDEVARRNEWDV